MEATPPSVKGVTPSPKGRVLLICGPARTGKSTLARILRRRIDGQVISGDAFTHGIRNALQEDWIPDLFTDTVDPVNLADAYEIQIARLRKRDRAMWQFARGYILAAQANSQDNVLMDGGFWPDALVDLPTEHRAVFLVDTSSDRAELLKRVRDTATENNWMRDRKYTDERIARWAQFDIARSRRFIELCELHGYPYFDIATYGIAGAQQAALDYLLQ